MGFAKEIVHRAHTHYYERRLGVETQGFFEPDVSRPGGMPYGAIGYEHLFGALRRVPFPPEQVEMIDFGCGKGRAVVVAATQPFRSVVGVELSPSLAAHARKNLAAMKGRRAGSVIIHEGDAVEFAVPPTANLFYFFNPFEGEPLRLVVSNIRESIQKYPRHAFLVYFNHKNFDLLVAGESWLRKIHDGVSYPDIGCGLYEIGSK